MNLNNTPTVGHRHFELVTVDVDGFATRREMPKRLHHQTTDGVDLFIAKVSAKRFVEIFNGSQCAHGPCVTAKLTEVDIIFFVILVFNLTNNQFGMSSMVTRPETPPNSSMTIAMWYR